jgi:DNA (cytosine-5)-methyltransferase 1
MSKPNIYWIDLFCGAGGTSTGIHLVNDNIKVLACVNHDAKAIESHKENHPDCVHFTEDIKDWRVISKLQQLVKDLREKEPNCIVNIWASLECIHFSKAKGGQSRDVDSRTLAEHLLRYVDAIDPHYLYIENVEEFLSWGPLDENGKPVKKLKGTDYNKWVNNVCNRTYDYDYSFLNAADFGAYTSRKRYFGIFAKEGLPIEFPEPTHIKRGLPNPNNLKEWKAVKDVLELDKEGVSIFGLNAKGKHFSENTLKRVYYGLKKFHTEGVFMKRYNGGCVNPEKKSKSANRPLGTILSNNTHAVVKPVFLTSYYGNGTSHSVEDPCNTLTTKERYALHSVEKKWLVDTQFNNKGRSVELPSPTLIARMDKKPMYMVSSGAGKVDNSVEKTGVRPIERLMRYFMRKHGVSDVKIRMLFLEELIRIQGFPEDYVLKGTKKDKLKFIGNSVVPLVAQKLAETNHKILTQC